jgi:hypothetical protein
MKDRKVKQVLSGGGYHWVVGEGKWLKRRNLVDVL